MGEYSPRFLFRNGPQDKLNEENDLFELIPKADAITKVLKSCVYSSDDEYDNNMIALYGNWGSGKTTLMKYMKNTHFAKEWDHNQKTYNVKTIFFEAWRYEKDDNLALSLFEQILDEVENDTCLNSTTEKFKDAKEKIKVFFKSLVYSSKASIKTTPIDLELNVGQALKDIFENESKKSSLYTQEKVLKESFKELDNTINGKYNKILIFIDDLDRCEPENVLNLLSSIKLFFTYSKETIYFCGVDKEAVSKAICLKYQKVLKAEEYLEKIFDITFNMPVSNDVTKLVEKYFSPIKLDDNTTFLNCCKHISNFLIAIDFTNPRHIKKAFNKLELLRRFKHSIDDDRIEDIDDDKNVLLIIFTLYFIILHEFKKYKFNELFSFTEKFYSYKSFMKIHTSESKGFQYFYDGNSDQPLSIQLDNALSNFKKYSIGAYFHMNIDEDKKYKGNILSLIFILLPKASSEFFTRPSNTIDSLDSFINQFDNNDISVKFLNFILYNHNNLSNMGHLNFSLDNLIYTIKSYL